MGKNEKKPNVYKRWLDNWLVRNIVLAVSLIVIFIFAVAMALNVFTRHNRYKEVPDFVGTGLHEAERLADKIGLRIEINDSLYVPAFDGGVVLEQRPSAGTEVKSGRRIFVTINSYRQKMVKVPYVTGFSLRQAKNLLETAGLEVGRLVYVDDIATNYVLEERVDGRVMNENDALEVEKGSGVTLTVGRSPDAAPVMVPGIVGLLLREARNRLWEQGLNIGQIHDDGINEMELKDARVYRQHPGQSVSVPLGTEVSFSLTLDSTKVAEGIRASEEALRLLMEERAREDSLRRAGISVDETEMDGSLSDYDRRNDFWNADR